MNKIQVVGYDPAFRNFGVAKTFLDIDTLDLEVISLNLCVTEKATAKTVRKSSDDFRRGQEIYNAMIAGAEGCMYGFAEIPAGSQDYASARGFGIAIGVLAAAPIPIIEVSNSEAKIAAVGTRTASKQEMIEWATEKWPNAPWLRARGSATGAFTNANEHLADALAITVAGINTKEFQRTLAFIRQSMKAAA